MISLLARIPEASNVQSAPADPATDCADGPLPLGRSEMGESIVEISAADMAHVPEQERRLSLTFGQLDEWGSVRMRGPRPPPVRLHDRTAVLDLATERYSSYLFRNPLSSQFGHIRG